MKPELSTNACSVKMVWFFCKASHSGCHSTVCSAYEAARYSARESHHYVTVFFPAFPETPSSSQQQRRTVSTTVAPGFAMFPWHPKWKVQCIYSASSHPCFCVMLFFCFFFWIRDCLVFWSVFGQPSKHPVPLWSHFSWPRAGHLSVEDTGSELDAGHIPALEPPWFKKGSESLKQ